MEGILPSHSFGSQVWGAESTKQGSVYQTLPLFLCLALLLFIVYSLFRGSRFITFLSILRWMLPHLQHIFQSGAGP